MKWELHEGDCLEVMKLMPAASVDAVVTDPPYAMAGGISNGRSALVDNQFFSHWFADVWKGVARVCADTGHAFLFCDWKTVGLLADVVNRTDWRATQAVIWDREGVGMGQPFRATYEMILYARGPKAGRLPIGTNTTNIIRERWPYGTKEHHPAEKPVPLLRRLINMTGARVVLDPFAGSGSTLVAAVQEGVSAVGIERESEYCETAKRRLAQLQMVV